MPSIVSPATITIGDRNFDVTRVAVSHLRTLDLLFGVSVDGAPFRRGITFVGERTDGLWMVKVSSYVRSDSQFPLVLDMSRTERAPYGPLGVRRGHHFLAHGDLIVQAHLAPRIPDAD